MPARPQQLALGVSLHDEATFANFYLPADGANRQAVSALAGQFDAEGERLLYLWGAPGAGLTHLLQAACHRAHACHYSAQYLPLKDLAGYAPEALFEGLESQDLICLDGLESVLGKCGWEEALFDLFNRARDAGKRLVFAASAGPKEIPLQLEDLRSRLNWGVVYQVEVLNDEEKQAALRMRAKARGMELSREVAQYILSRASRDMSKLFELLNRLDELSLQEQRKLTIPFVKQVL